MNKIIDRPLVWILGSVLLVAAATALLWFGTNITDKGPTFDESWTQVPIEDLVEKGWSIQTAIDFKETKGPTLIWTYAVFGAVIGHDLNHLRALSVLFFVFGVVPLILICRQCELDGPVLLLVALFYVLLPYNALLGQLVMSEPSFVFGSLWLCWVFMWGLGAAGRPAHRVAGPVIFGLLLAILLHSRIHAAAFAGAAVLVALERDGVRSWPWWLAALAAGLSRAPLWIRWGGLVSPGYASMHELGLNLDSLTYFAAAYAPFTAVFLWPAFANRFNRGRWWLIFCGAALGLGLGLLASPSLSETLRFREWDVLRFQGVVGTAARTLIESIRPIRHIWNR